MQRAGHCVDHGPEEQQADLQGEPGGDGEQGPAGFPPLQGEQGRARVCKVVQAGCRWLQSGYKSVQSVCKGVQGGWKAVPSGAQWFQDHARGCKAVQDDARLVQSVCTVVTRLVQGGCKGVQSVCKGEHGSAKHVQVVCKVDVRWYKGVQGCAKWYKAVQGVYKVV